MNSFHLSRPTLTRLAYLIHWPDIRPIDPQIRIECNTPSRVVLRTGYSRLQSNALNGDIANAVANDFLRAHRRCPCSIAVIIGGVEYYAVV